MFYRYVLTVNVRLGKELGKGVESSRRRFVPGSVVSAAGRTPLRCLLMSMPLLLGVLLVSCITTGV